MYNRLIITIYTFFTRCFVMTTKWKVSPESNFLKKIQEGLRANKEPPQPPNIKEPTNTKTDISKHDTSTNLTNKPKDNAVKKEIIGNIYNLTPDVLSTFSELKKNYVMKGGSKLNLKYEESRFSKHELMIKLTQDGHTLIFHTPLYLRTAPLTFFLEHQNGMLMSFSERKPFVEFTFKTTKKRFRDLSFRNSKMSRSKSKFTAMSTHDLPAPSEHLKSPSLTDVKTENIMETKEMEESAKNRWLRSFEENRLMFFEKFTQKSVEQTESDKVCQCAETIFKEQFEKYCDMPSDLEDGREKCCEPEENVEKHQNNFVSSPFANPLLDKVEQKKPPCEFDLQISWKSGLHISTNRYKENKFYIKQQYLVPRKDLHLIEDEEFRCNLVNGTVIKFMPNNVCILYYSFGMIVTCENVCWTDFPDNSPNKTQSLQHMDSFTSRKGTSSHTLENVMEINRKINFPLNRILTSDGKYFNVISDISMPIETQYSTDDVYDSFCNTRKISRTDGTVFLFTEDGMLVVRFPDGTETRSEVCFEEEEYFTPWSQDELEKWFDLEDVDVVEEELVKRHVEGEDEGEEELEGEQGEEEGQEKLEYTYRITKKVYPSRYCIEEDYFGEEGPEELCYDRISALNDGFVIVSIWSYTVYHPYFAEIASGCMEEKIFSLRCPGETTIHFSGNGLYTIVIGNEGNTTKLKVGPEKLTMETNKNDLLLQKSIINYSITKYDVMKNSSNILFVTTTDDFASITVKANGDINYKAPPETNSTQSNPESTKYGKRLIFIRPDFTGTEFLSKSLVKCLFENIAKVPGGKVQKFRESIISHSIGMLPIESIVNYWQMRYVPIKTRNRYVIPSTYGDTLFFPLQQNAPTCEIPKIIMFNVVKTVEFDDLERTFYGFLKKYNDSFDKDETDLGCRCTVNCLSDGIVGREDSTLCRHFYETEFKFKPFGRYFFRWLRRNLVRQILRMTTNQYKIQDRSSNLKNDMHNLYIKRYPIYFESSQGTVYTILEEIIQEAESVILEIHKFDTLDILLDTPMDDLTDQMICDLVTYLQPSQEGLATKSELTRVLIAARNLKEYFPTIRAALKYRKEVLAESNEESEEANNSVTSTDSILNNVPIDDNLNKGYFDFIDQYVYRGTREISRVKLRVHSEPKYSWDASVLSYLQTRNISLPDSHLYCAWATKKMENVKLAELEGFCEDVQGTKKKVAEVLYYLIKNANKNLKDI